MRTLALLVWVTTFASAFALTRTAAACTLVSPYQEYATESSSDVAAPVLSGASIVIQRAESPQAEECGDVGQFLIRVDASDDVTSKDDLGFALSVVDGRLPFMMPSTYVQSSHFRKPGELTSWFNDDGGSFDGTLEVKVVDRAGNASNPVQVRAKGRDITGCSLTGPQVGSRGWLFSFAFGLTAWCVRSRSKRAS
jgi:hypothetical protein